MHSGLPSSFVYRQKAEGNTAARGAAGEDPTKQKKLCNEKNPARFPLTAVKKSGARDDKGGKKIAMPEADPLSLSSAKRAGGGRRRRALGRPISRFFPLPPLPQTRKKKVNEWVLPCPPLYFFCSPPLLIPPTLALPDVAPRVQNPFLFYIISGGGRIGLGERRGGGQGRGVTYSYVYANAP